jgi:trehalose/maltose hydrolase-like predicted phosphorylase
LLLPGCQPKAETAQIKPTPASEASIDPWLLATLDANAEEPALLWNGLLGFRLGRDATGAGAFFAIDEYETTGEEKIRALSNPMSAIFRVGDTILDPKQGTNYQQSLDMSTGILQTGWEQDAGGSHLKIEVQSAIHPEKREIGDRWTFTCTSPVQIEAKLSEKADWKLSGSPAQIGDQYKAKLLLAPNGMKVNASFYVSGGTTKEGIRSNVRFGEGAFQFLGACGDGRPATLERVLSFGPSPNVLEILGARGIRAKMTADWDQPEATPKFAELTKQCREIWTEHWKTDIEIDGPKVDQLAVRSFFLYLRSAIHPGSIMSVSPYGLSNKTYNGHVFWDADLWVFPALAMIEPDGAAQIVHYRQALMGQAKKNFQGWINAGRPTGSKSLGGTVTGTDLLAMKFPWESSVSGKETVVGPSKFQDHVTGTIAFAQVMAARLGLMGAAEAKQIVSGAAGFYRQRASAPLGEVSIEGTMSPDEFHTGDNDLYTNLLAEWCMGERFDLSRYSGYTGVHFFPKLPRDDKSFLTYDNDPVKGYKQAAAVLAIYPLQYPPAEKEAKVMMDRFADKVTENGPAMSDSIHALIWARIGEKEKAYETWHKSWQPFTDHPLMLFSEKRNKAVTYFTTGAAGCLQAVIYGFLGFRIDEGKQLGALWSEGPVSIKPNLPSQWKSVTFKGARIRGKTYTFRITSGSVIVD